MIGAILIGLVAGYIGLAMTPGPAPGGFPAAVLLGELGAIAGFLLFTEALGAPGLVGAALGAIVVLVAWRGFVLSRKRPQR